MDTWAVVLMIILVLAVGAVSGTVYYLEKKNNNDNKKNIIYPFTGHVKNGAINLNSSTGAPQITCAGKSENEKINIVGAFFDIEDPYGQCTGNPASVLDSTCGIPNGKETSCNTSDDCGNGMKCSQGKCTPAGAFLKDDKTIDKDNSECSVSGDIDYCPVNPGTKCSSDEECNAGDETVMYCNTDKTCQVKPNAMCYGVNTQYNTCALFPLCGNRTRDKDIVINKECNYRDKKCIPRDSSAYLAKICDGKKSCIETGIQIYDSNGDQHKNSPLGPLPCKSTTKLKELPVTPGESGNFNQGYYFHGIYTCT